MDAETVTVKLEFSKNRLNDFQDLISKNRLSSDAKGRQQIIQEFFFHLLGATEYLAQLANDKKGLAIPVNKVRIHTVSKNLSSTDPLIPYLRSLSADTRKDPMPADPYSEDGLIWRAINYRNEVVHRNTNPLHFKMGSGPSIAHFWLDPQDHSQGESKDSVDADLKNMYALVELKCNGALAILP